MTKSLKTKESLVGLWYNIHKDEIISTFTVGYYVITLCVGFFTLYNITHGIVLKNLTVGLNLIFVLPVILLGLYNVYCWLLLNMRTYIKLSKLPLSKEEFGVLGINSMADYMLFIAIYSLLHFKKTVICINIPYYVEQKVRHSLLTELQVVDEKDYKNVWYYIKLKFNLAVDLPDNNELINKLAKEVICSSFTELQFASDKEDVKEVIQTVMRCGVSSDCIKTCQCMLDEIGITDIVLKGLCNEV